MTSVSLDTSRLHQQPIPSGWGRATTSSQVMSGVDLTGRLAVVTGGHAGLGRETVRCLAAAGAQVIVGARSTEAATAALAGMPGIVVKPLDLSDRASVDRFAEDVVGRGRSLDLLINNAGIMAVPLARDAQGHESQWSTNHLGPFRLTASLWPALVRSGSARVVMLSSGAHRFSAVDLNDPNYLNRSYDKWGAYGQSKTAAALFAVALDAKGAGSGVRAFSVHPGSIRTGLSQHLTLQDLRDIGAVDAQGQVTPAFEELSKTLEQGAATTLWCATSAQLEGRGGVYCEDCDVSPLLDASDKSLHGVLPWACDPQAASALWDLSEQQSGIVFKP